MKFLVVSSSGRIRKMALFSAANFSASIAESKQSTCSNSESRNAFRRDSTVDMTDAIACSAEFNAAPANHLALCSDGSLDISTWNKLLPFTFDGSSRSCTSLKTETMCLRSTGSSVVGGRYSDSNRITEVSKPSAAS